MSFSLVKFVGEDTKRVGSTDRYDRETNKVKLLAKMFRQMTHIKPPRGRDGLHLPFAGHYAVEIKESKATQAQFTLESELELIENKRPDYNITYQMNPNANMRDIQRLETWHQKHTSKTRVENTVNTLSDLVNGLMGLGMTSLSIEPDGGYHSNKYLATMMFADFIITVEEVEK